MATTFELWDTETHNRVAVFDSREDALAAVRRTLDTQGRALAETLLLGVEEDDGESERIAEGTELLELALSKGTPGTGTPGAATPQVTQASPIHAAHTLAAKIVAEHARANQEALNKAFASYPLTEATLKAFEPSPVPQMLSEAFAGFALDRSALNAFTQPMLSEVARSFQTLTGALAFSEALQSFPNTGEFIAALVANGRAKIAIGPDESILEFPATEEIVERLVAEKAIAPSELEGGPHRVVQLRVRGEAYFFAIDPPDEYRAAGD